MIPGKTNRLFVSKILNSGYELSDGAESAFIPKILASESWQEGDEVEAFVYQDDGAYRATTEAPYAETGEFGLMKCVQVLPSGAFLDWGIIKDLFVPYKQQKGKMEEGKRYLVYVFTDDATGLVTGTTKFKRNQSYEETGLAKNDKVQLIIAGESEIGWNVVINKKYLGLIYTSDVYKKLFPLSEEVGYVKEIREDGKIDVSLQPTGFENIEAYKEKVLKKFEENYGLLFLTDASSPEEIRDELQMSKKNFKKALGSLYKEKKIEILEDRVKLL